MEKQIKAKKEWSCDDCGAAIRPGEEYMLYKYRVPRYGDDGETQVGVEYLVYRSCVPCKDEVDSEIEKNQQYIQTDEYKYYHSM